MVLLPTRRRQYLGSRLFAVLGILFVASWVVNGQDNGTDDEGPFNGTTPNSENTTITPATSGVPQNVDVDDTDGTSAAADTLFAEPEGSEVPTTTTTPPTTDAIPEEYERYCTQVPLGSFMRGGIINGTKVSLLLALPLTMEGAPYLNPGYYQLAAALMAMNQFNERNPAVVPDLETLQDCPIQMDFETLLVMDTGTVESKGMETVWKNFHRESFLPTAIIGPYNLIPANELSVVATTLEVPMISHRAIDHTLLMPWRHPFANQMNPDLYSEISLVVDYLVRLGRDYVAVVYDVSSDNALQRLEGFKVEATRRNLEHTQTFGYLAQAEFILDPFYATQNIAAAMEKVKSSGYRTIVWMTADFDGEFARMGQAAHQHGLDKGDHMWVIASSVDLDGPFNQTNFSKIYHFNEHQKKEVSFLLSATYIKSGELLDDVKDKGHSPFFKEWMKQNETFIEQLMSINPINASGYQKEWKLLLKFAQNIASSNGAPGGGYDFEGEEFPPSNLFSKPQPFVSYPTAGTFNIFDSVMAVGIGACRTLKMIDGREADATIELGPNTIISGKILQKAIRSTKFYGATGEIEFGGDGFPGSRTGASLSYTVLSLFPKGFSGELFALTDVRIGGEWYELRPFVYANNSTEPPLPLRDPGDQNYLSDAMQATGLALMGSALAMILGSVVWIYVYWNHRVVTASQPFFLLLMCFGATLISLTILTLTFDEGDGFTADQMTGFCLAGPWFLILGHIITYNALFTKLWRVNTVLQFSRRRVKIIHVVWPAVLLEAIAVVLLSLMTAISGYSWERVEIDELTGDSIGVCTGENVMAWGIAIAVVAFVPMLLTGIFAWKTIDVDEAYSEAKWIFALMLIQTQVILVGIPIILLLETVSADGRYMGVVLICWTFPTSTIGLIMGPKFVSVHFSSKKETRGTVVGVKVSGVTGPLTSSVVADRGSITQHSHVRSSNVDRESPLHSQVSEG